MTTNTGSIPPQRDGPVTTTPTPASTTIGAAHDTEHDHDHGQDAGQAAGAAKEQSQHVAGVAKGEAGRVVGEARDQVRGLLDEATTQVQEQSAQQKDRLASTVRSFGDDLEQMRPDDLPSGLAAQVVDQVTQGARTVADRLEGREPAELLDDLRHFARERPGTFLLGALAAGIVVGRVARGTRDAGGDTDVAAGHTPTSTTVGTPGTAATVDPSVDPTVDPTGLSATHDQVRDGAHDAGASWTGTDTPVTSPSLTPPGTGPAVGGTQ